MNNNTYVTIGKRICEIRRAHKITQEELAEQLGVSPKHISHTERGTSSLSLKNLINFCTLYNCSLDYIVFGNSNNIALSKLPSEIVDILQKDNEQEISMLNQYLNTYILITSNRKGD